MSHFHHVEEASPLASVIILTWNGLDFIEACLNSVLSQTYPNFEVIIVDNASEDGTADFVATNFPGVRLIRNAGNLGFAVGMNVGLTQAQGEFLVLLNQDTIVEPDWLNELVQGMSADSQVGIGGCKILDWSGEKIWHAGVVLEDKKRNLVALRGAGETDQGQYEQPAEMLAVVGAAFAIRRELLETVGLLDEDYFFYWEDTDYCFRARKAGYKVMYYPRAKLRHYVAASLKKDSYEVLYRFHFSRMLFLLKHYSIDWFCHNFVPAEKEYLKNWVSLNEFKALRHAYLNTAFQIARGDLRYPINHDKAGLNKNIEDVLRALTDLRDYSLATLYNPEGKHGIYSWSEEKEWQLKAFEFQSKAPIIGFLLTGIRRLWSSIAAKWIERNLMNQQNAINHKLVAAQMALISTLNGDIAVLNDQLIELTRYKTNTTDVEQR